MTTHQKRNIQLSLEDFEKNKKYKPAFVRKLSEQVNKTFHAWLDARKKNNFGVWEPELDRLLTLKREESHILGFEEHPYDAHLNEYDKGVTVALLDQEFFCFITGAQKFAIGRRTRSKRDPA